MNILKLIFWKYQYQTY